MGFFSKFFGSGVPVYEEKESNYESSLYYAAWQDKPYQNLLHKHYKLTEEINAMASVLYNLKIVQGDKMNVLISKCQDDIALAPKLIVYWQKYGDKPPAYEGYRRLCMIYEKQEKYGEAMKTCADAIRLGFVNDGSKGQMYGRLARLMRKSGVTVSIDEYLQFPR